MLIAFVRHGESVANGKGLIQGRGDHPLSDKGRDQALKTAEALKDFDPYHVFTSPLSRALESAQIINRPHNARITVLDDLIEYNLGEFEGLTMEQALERFPDVREKMDKGTPFHLLAPGGETDEEADLRAGRALDQVLDAGIPRAIVVAHLGSLERMLLLAADRYHVPAIDRAGFPLLNCSITRVELAPVSIKLISMNDVAHLA